MLTNYKIIDVADVSRFLDEETEVYAFVLNVKDRIIKGGETIKQGVYTLNCNMSYKEVKRFKEEPDVIFIVLNTEDTKTADANEGAGTNAETESWVSTTC